MSRSMISRLPILVVILAVFGIGIAFAHNKVVVIPLESDVSMAGGSSAFAVDASDVELGLVMGVDENCCLVVVLNEKSYFLRVSLTDGQISSNGLFYTNPTCSGTPYTAQAAGTVIKNGLALYYVDRASLSIGSLTVQSSLFDGICSVSSGTIQAVWQASPNDPLITGVSFSDFPFQLPIRFERR